MYVFLCLDYNYQSVVRNLYNVNNALLKSYTSEKRQHYIIKPVNVIILTLTLTPNSRDIQLTIQIRQQHSFP